MTRSTLAVFVTSFLLLSPALCNNSKKTTRVSPGGAGIQYALDHASPGDHIVVEAGVYPEQLSITTPSITLSGKPGATIVQPATFTSNACSGLAGNDTEAGICISGSGITYGEFEVPGHHKVTSVDHPINDVTVEGLSVVGFGLSIAVLGAHDAEVRKNNLTDGGWYGILTVGSTSSLITRNTITHTTSADFPLFFIGICMDDFSPPQVTVNTISNYGIGLCIQTDRADVSHNQVHDTCFGAIIDPGVASAHVTHNHVSHTNKLCNDYFGGSAAGILIDGAVGAEVRHNDISGITDYGNPNMMAYGIGIVDETDRGLVSKDNQVTHNTLYDNDLDIWLPTNGTNEIAHNKCNTPTEICGK
jgi:nitrous oxidase accessory protein NosD